MVIIEYQTIRPSGTVLRSALVPEGASHDWGPEDPGFEIRGEIINRYRILPGGKWVVTARRDDAGNWQAA